MVKSEFDDCFQNGNYDALRPYHVDNAIILAAGMCSRFKPLSDTKPKAFLKVKGEILIERMIRQLIEAEIPEIYIVGGHQKEARERFFKDDMKKTEILIDIYDPESY